MALVYILLSKNFNKTYVGSTTDLNRRIKEHNAGNHKFTKRYVPWEIMHIEKYPALIEARKREKYLKSCAGRKFIKNLMKN